ncbi:MAG: elongation factor 1-beta [Candidatus Micrarchaeota archaeon]|nr:elongation factor 1-beta [Candidatus Micrarchaeota archaeon]
MGSVAVTFRIMPEEAEGFEQMKRELFSSAKPVKTEEKEIAFGLKAIYATFIIPDGEGGADRLEEKIRAIKGVGQVDVEAMDRL